MIHDPCCIGCPASLVTGHWDQNMRQEHFARFGPGIPTFNTANTVWNFLHLRMGSDGQPLSNKVVRMQRYADGWVRCSLLPEDTQKRLEHEGWHQGWHGSRFECVYSILFDAQLQPSWSKKLGHRYQAGKPGIYLHKSKNRRRSEFADLKRTDLGENGLKHSWTGIGVSSTMSCGSRSQVP